MSPIWSKLTKFKLTTAQRTREDTSYTEFLLCVGDGSINSVSFGKGRDQLQLIPLEGISFTSELSFLLEFILPNSVLSDPDACSKRVLCFV